MGGVVGVGVGCISLRPVLTKHPFELSVGCKHHVEFISRFLSKLGSGLNNPREGRSGAGVGWGREGLALSDITMK